MVKAKKRSVCKQCGKKKYTGGADDSLKKIEYKLAELEEYLDKLLLSHTRVMEREYVTKNIIRDLKQRFDELEEDTSVDNNRIYQRLSVLENRINLPENQDDPVRRLA
jgi:predicted nuclease with TOPRIM domain